MQKRRFGSIGDLVKLAFLRHLQEGRHPAVCWYLTGQGANRPLPEKHFAYLKRPDEFRYLAPEIFDTLKSVGRGNFRLRLHHRDGSERASKRCGLSS